MSEINLLSEVYHTRVIGEYGTWITLILAQCDAKLALMVEAQVVDTMNILYESCIYRFVYGYGTWITVKVFIYMVTDKAVNWNNYYWNLSKVMSEARS